MGGANKQYTQILLFRVRLICGKLSMDGKLYLFLSIIYPFPLQESQEFASEPNTLGMLSLDEAVAGASVGYVFRFKPGASGNIDFVVAGKVR